jgi:hypothetical protein
MSATFPLPSTERFQLASRYGKYRDSSGYAIDWVYNAIDNIWEMDFSGPPVTPAVPARIRAVDANMADVS